MKRVAQLNTMEAENKLPVHAFPASVFPEHNKMMVIALEKPFFKMNLLPLNSLN